MSTPASNTTQKDLIGTMKEKRALLCLLAAGLIVNLVACGGSNDNAADNSQDTSTPAVTQSVESSTPEVTPTPEQTTQIAPETTPTTESISTSDKVDTSASPEAESLFTETDETLYATTTVNVRSSYSTNSDKLGSLTKAQSVKRTGIGTGAAAGWSRIEFNGKVAYVSSDYLSATKPQVSVSKPSTGSSSGSTQTSKPSTKPSSKPSTGGSGGGNSQTTTSGSEIDTGSENTSSGSSGLSGLAGAIQQEREDLGYSGGGVGGQLTDEDREWISGQVNVGG